MSGTSKATCLVPTVWRSELGVSRSSGMGLGLSYSNSSISKSPLRMKQMRAFKGGTKSSFTSSKSRFFWYHSRASSMFFTLMPTWSAL